MSDQESKQVQPIVEQETAGCKDTIEYKIIHNNFSYLTTALSQSGMMRKVGNCLFQENFLSRDNFEQFSDSTKVEPFLLEVLKMIELDTVAFYTFVDALEKADQFTVAKRIRSALPDNVSGPSCQFRDAAQTLPHNLSSLCVFNPHTVAPVEHHGQVEGQASDDVDQEQWSTPVTAAGSSCQATVVTGASSIVRTTSLDQGLDLEAAQRQIITEERLKKPEDLVLIQKLALIKKEMSKEVKKEVEQVVKRELRREVEEEVKKEVKKQVEDLKSKQNELAIRPMNTYTINFFSGFTISFFFGSDHDS